MEVPAENRSTAELLADLKKPVNPADLLANIKWLMDHDLLLRTIFTPKRI